MLGKERAGLIAAYAGVALVFILVSRGGSLAPAAVAAFLATLWLGFVLAISFMEAWVKFRAPFLPRHLGVDVGRVVFCALHSVEFALAAGLLVHHAVTGLDEASEGSAFRVLVALVVIFVVQVVWLYPKLELRGDFVLFEQLKRMPDDTLTVVQRMQRNELMKNVQNYALPSLAFHFVYVASEVVKVALLLVYIAHYLRELSKK